MIVEDKSYLGYEVGDSVYIFGRNDSYASGLVTKISATGQVSVQTTNFAGDTIVRRFTWRGKEIGSGGSYYRAPYIEPKSEQDAVAAERKKVWDGHRAKQEWIKWVDELRTMHPTVDRIATISTLRAKINELEKIK